MPNPDKYHPRWWIEYDKATHLGVMKSAYGTAFFRDDFGCWTIYRTESLDPLDPLDKDGFAMVARAAYPYLYNWLRGRSGTR